MTSLLPERSAIAIRKAFLRHIGFYGQRGIRISALLSDNEQGITSLGLKFGGAKIVLTQSGPGMHVPQVERSIRAVKEETRGILHTLPYNCPLVLFAHLPEFVAARMSIFKTSTRPSDITAFQILHGWNGGSCKRSPAVYILCIFFGWSRLPYASNYRQSGQSIYY